MTSSILSLQVMNKRRVSSALHSELTEYTSLLRALRTNDALDVTKHLTNAPSFARMDDLADIDLLSSSPLAGPSDLNHPNNFDFADESDNGSSRKGKSREGSVQPRNRRNHWTRWPLLMNDVLPPKWTLDDEIAVIAAQTLKRRPSPQLPMHCEEDLDDEGEQENVPTRDLELDEEDPDIPFFVPYLTTTIANFLSTILALLNAHTPARPASMQNRVEPLDWRAVIDVIVCSGIPEYSNPKIVENVVKRLQAIYGQSSSLPHQHETAFRAVERIKRKAEWDTSFENMMDKEMEQLFSRPILRQPSVQNAQKEINKRTEPGVDPGYRSRVNPAKRQKVAHETINTSTPDAPGTSPRRSRRPKPAINYYIPPAPDIGEGSGR